MELVLGKLSKNLFNHMTEKYFWKNEKNSWIFFIKINIIVKYDFL
jgi:hypothetical protein